MKKKILFTLLPLFSFVFLACFGNDLDEARDIFDEVRDEIETETERGQTTPSTTQYITHVPESEFEVEFRATIDELLQQHVGYSEVVARERDDLDDMLNLWSWGYKLNSPMTEEDYIALDIVLDHENLFYWTEGNDDSIDFDMYLNEFGGTVEDIEKHGFAGMFEADSGKDYLISFNFDPEEQIFWVGNLMY